MDKVIISVCKAYKNSGKGRKHREKTKKHWKVYGTELLDNGKWKFFTIWPSYLVAMWYKSQIKQRQKVYCIGCWEKFEIAKGSNPPCPNCGILGDNFDDVNNEIEEENEEDEIDEYRRPPGYDFVKSMLMPK